MDKFPEKRKDVKLLTGMKDMEPVMWVVEQVVQFLMTKAIYEHTKQDVSNQTIVGNVSFYLAYNTITKETKLSFDKHPSMWHIQNIVEEMRNMEADMMLEQQQGNDYITNNPFTY